MWAKLRGIECGVVPSGPLRGEKAVYDSQSLLCILSEHEYSAFFIHTSYRGCPFAWHLAYEPCMAYDPGARSEPYRAAARLMRRATSWKDWPPNGRPARSEAWLVDSRRFGCPFPGIRNGLICMWVTPGLAKSVKAKYLLLGLSAFGVWGTAGRSDVSRGHSVIFGGHLDF